MDWGEPIPVLRRLLDRAGRRIGCYLFDLDHRPESAIWLVGYPRSGTTWVASLIDYDERRRSLFEPFHPDHVSWARPYPKFFHLPRGAEDPHLEQAYARIFAGHILHPRVDLPNRRAVFRGRIIKDVYAHLITAWIDEHFPRVRKILLLRHPFAVALSARALPSWDWPGPEVLLAQRSLRHGPLAPFEEVLRSSNGPFEKQVTLWAAVHHVLFADMNPERIHISFYEDLAFRPMESLPGLFRAVIDGRGARRRPLSDPRLLLRFRTPSPVSRDGGRLRRGEHEADAWSRQLTSQEIDRGLKILERFGLVDIYDESAMPDRAALARLIGATVET